MTADENASAKGKPAPQFRAISEPQRVPVFSCMVYVARHERGKVKARVANLPDIEYSADSEPAALRLVVTEFKRRLGEWTAHDDTIPWIEPPLAPAPGERQRLIPVHL